MKNLKVWLVFLPLLTIACTDEYTSGTDNIEKSAIGSGNSGKSVNAHKEILDTASEGNQYKESFGGTRINLAVTSIVEYSLNEAEDGGRKDKDWETSVTKIVPAGSRAK